MNIPFEEIGSGQPVVLLHAFPLNRKMWQMQAQALAAKNYRVILPDLRGFGENNNFADINTMEDMARDIAQLLDTLKVEKAVIGGLSMGGYVLFNFYRLFPQKISGLIFCDTGCAADTDEKRETRFDLIEKIEAEGSQALINEMLPNLVSPHTRKSNNELMAKIEEMFRAADPKGAIAALRGMAERQDTCNIMGEIKVPVLLIFGEDDKVTNLEIAGKMQETISKARLITIKNAGHYSNLEQPEQFNSALIDFLGAVKAA